MNKPKKKFKETRVGMFLSNVAPELLGAASDLLPDAGVLRMVGKLIKGDDGITPENKEEALKLLEMDIVMEQEISKRWESDLHSDSWASKNIRPYTLAFLLVCMFVFIILDSSVDDFSIKTEWISLLKGLLMTAVGGYFVVRSGEKIINKIKS